MTTREKVKDMLAKGLTPRQIALTLGLSTQAIYKHVARLKAQEARAS